MSKNTIKDGLVRGRRAAGDLIPWTVAQQYQDQDFPALAGARIVRIATHPDYHGVNIDISIVNIKGSCLHLENDSVADGIR